MENKPDFLVVGAAKSGTTSLFHYLNSHPDIYIPEIKECRFFSQLPKNFKGLGAEYFQNSGITDPKEYFSLFSNHEEEICGDISNDYLYYYDRSIVNIKKYLDREIKIIIILRSPIDRAYSNFMHSIRDDWENLTFEEAIIEEPYRIKNNWAWPYHYVRVGMYYYQVKAYLENFKNVKIYLFEDFVLGDSFFRDLFSFLGVNFIKNDFSNKFNISGYPRSKLIHKLINNDYVIKRLFRPLVRRILPNDFTMRMKNKNLKKKDLSIKTRLYLEYVFKDDIYKLSKLINRDLSHWIADGI